MKKVAILQSNYIPWKGYFDIINMVDEFILYDDMQYTRRDWRNRNKLITPQGVNWLTIPVEVKGKFYQKIKETQVTSGAWAEKHWRAWQENYARAPFFDLYARQIHELYQCCADEKYLSRINYIFLTGVCSILDIKTKITWSMDYELHDGKSERLAFLVRAAGGDSYLSGPAAKDYIQPQVFRDLNIKLDWMEYSGYPVYKQMGQTFEHGVSIFDLLFNVGNDATKYMKSFVDENK